MQDPVFARKKPVEGIGDPGASPGPVNSWSFNAQKRFPGGEGRRSQPRHPTKPEASGPKTNRASFRPCSGCVICLFLSCFCVIYVAIHVNLAFLFVSFFCSSLYLYFCLVFIHVLLHCATTSFVFSLVLHHALALLH